MTNWNARQTFAPWQTCPVCGKYYREDEPGYCSVRCEDAATDGGFARKAKDGSSPESKEARPHMDVLGEWACECNGEGKCGWCAEEAMRRAEALGEAWKERGL